MTPSPTKASLYAGVSLAILAAIIWSGNFVIARGIHDKIPPVSINFFRWLTATIFMFPIAFKTIRAEKNLLMKNWKYFFWVSLTCILFFNTFLYIAGHHTSAINMALIGTTSSPVFTIVMAAIFLREPVKPLRIAGMCLCISGILVLLSQGSLQHLLDFRFSSGDWWILASSVFFAIYNLLVKQKPSGISPISFLMIFFFFGTILLLPFYIWEHQVSAPIQWSKQLYLVILYLGIGTSILAYFCWNAAIARIGSSRTALFGNLIPVFSSVEALLILEEKLKPIHLVSGLLVIAGIALANLRMANAGGKPKTVNSEQ